MMENRNLDNESRARIEEEEREKEFQRRQAEEKQKQLADRSGDRKLSSDELETLAKTLKLVVKHRGGGPFGAGRLEGLEADEMIKALRDTLGILKQDASVTPTTVAAAPMPAPAPAPAPTARAPVPAPVPAPAPVTGKYYKLYCFMTVSHSIYVFNNLHTCLI